MGNAALTIVNKWCRRSWNTASEDGGPKSSDILQVALTIDQNYFTQSNPFVATQPVDLLRHQNAKLAVAQVRWFYRFPMSVSGDSS